METHSASMTVIERLEQATNAHDLDEMAACFAPDFRSEFPNHPDRSFIGPAQMRRNWAAIFTAVPDIVATIRHATADGDTVWTEWEMGGTRHDGSAHLMRGAIIFGVDGERIRWARLYLEPVVDHDGDSDAAVRQMLRGGVA